MAIINTKKGLIDEALLQKKTGGVDNDKETTKWVEYWLNGELVHRSAHVTLKKPPTMGARTGDL
jgi:hypothetical protein